MGKYSQETYSKVILKPINLETYEKINELLCKDETVTRFINFNYTDDTFGIFYENNLVGIINTYAFIEGNRSTNVAVLNEFRGKGIAQVAREKIVDEFGSLHPNSRMFLANINPRNESSLKSLKNLGWSPMHEYDEMMMDEGAEFFILFSKDNPYYKEVHKNVRK